MTLNSSVVVQSVMVKLRWTISLHFQACLGHVSGRFRIQFFMQKVNWFTKLLDLVTSISGSWVLTSDQENPTMNSWFKSIAIYVKWVDVEIVIGDPFKCRQSRNFRYFRISIPDDAPRQRGTWTKNWYKNLIWIYKILYFQILFLIYIIYYSFQGESIKYFLENLERIGQMVRFSIFSYSVMSLPWLHNNILASLIHPCMICTIYMDISAYMQGCYIPSTPAWIFSWFYQIPILDFELSIKLLLTLFIADDYIF